MKSRKTEDISVSHFDLDRTLHSGQIFHAMPSGRGWEVLVGRRLLFAEQKEHRLRVTCGNEQLARDYFSLDHPLETVYAAFPPDPFSRAALESCRGLRILRQPHWECLATFITSPMKQVAHIRQISLRLRENFGTPVAGSSINAYPKPAQLASATESSLRDCGLGFRAKNLLATARAIASGKLDLAGLTLRPTAEVRDRLCELPGVGRKVANCVLLFAYARLEAVPVDVWMAKILRAMRGRKSTNLELERYSHRRFGAYAGYVQQYLFHHARMTKTLPAA